MSSGQPLATVALLTFQGEEFLSEVLDAIFGQQAPFGFEVLAIDSGSRDRTLEILRSYPDVRLLEIPNAEFGHGKTRNLAASMAAGRYVAFLTQDATPASPEWLSRLVEAFSLDERVACVYGPHLPRPDADPKVSRELTDFFGGMSPSGEPVVHREGDIDFFSDVNACIDTHVWREVPYRDLAYAEDQAFARDILAAGYAKVFEPRAPVVHSHSYPPGQYFRRMFDEWTGLRAAIGFRYEGGLRRAAKDAVWLARQDVAYIRSLPMSRAAKLRWMARVAAMDAGRQASAYLAEREERLPGWLKVRLSHERNRKRKMARRG